MIKVSHLNLSSRFLSCIQASLTNEVHCWYVNNTLPKCCLDTSGAPGNLFLLLSLSYLYYISSWTTAPSSIRLSADDRAMYGNVHSSSGVLSSQGERDRTAPSKLHCVKAAVRQNNSASIEHSVKTARDKIVRDQTAQHQCGTATK